MNLTAISEKERRFLKDLQARTGHKSLVDLINEALTLLDFQLRNIEQGGSLPYQDTAAGCRREIAVSSFMNVLREGLAQRECPASKQALLAGD